MSDLTHKFGDVPLLHAMLAWNPARCGDGRIIVIPHPDEDGWTNRLKLSDTTCADWTWWATATKQQRLAKLYIEAWHIACRDGVSIRSIHEALMVIPEYRETMSGDKFFSQQAPNQTKAEIEIKLKGYENHLAREQTSKLLDRMEDMATAAENAELVFDVMALKQNLGLSTKRPSTPTN
jgi:hypothetical protein